MKASRSSLRSKDEGGQSFHIASSKGHHYSDLTLASSFPGTVQPRGPLKGNVSQEFGIKIKECKGDVLSFMFRNVSGQFCAAPCAGTVALPPETYNLEWEMAL